MKNKRIPHLAYLGLAALIGFSGCSGKNNGSTKKPLEVKDRLYDHSVRINSLDDRGMEYIKDFIFDEDHDGKPDYLLHIDESFGARYNLVPKACANVSRPNEQGIHPQCSKESIAKGYARIMSSEVEDATTKILESRRSFRRVMYADSENYYKSRSTSKK